MNTETETELVIRDATINDTELILYFIKALADYEKLSHEVVATEDGLRRSLFGDDPKAEVIIAEFESEPVGFALFFHNYSTFLGEAGIYLEDLFVKPEMRGRGFGKALLAHLAKLAVDRNFGRLTWWVLDWNQPAMDFYESIGARAMNDWTVNRLDGQALQNLASNCKTC